MATVIAPTTPAPVSGPVPSIPFAPAGLLEWQAREIVHSGELATAKGLRLIGRGTCRVAGHVGEPVYIVSSASRPDGAHIVWIESGRIHCDCPRRTKGHGFTCSHAQFVRLLIVAELADARSLPDAARLTVQHVEPTPTPELTRTRDQVACPQCGAAITRRALVTYGGCVDCHARATAAHDAADEQWICEPATDAATPEPEPAATPEPEPATTPEPEPEPPTPAPTRRPRARKRAAEPAPAAAPEEPSAHAGGPSGPAGRDHGPDRRACPNCGALTDAAELEELGECLCCLQMRADFDRGDDRADAADNRAIEARAIEKETEQWAQDEAERMAEELAQRLPCWCCGEPATAETDHGLYCDDCVKLAPGEQRRRARGSLAAEKVAQTHAAVEARRPASVIAAKAREEEKASARRNRAHDRKARATDDANPGAYERRPFSIWKSDQGR